MPLLHRNTQESEAGRLQDPGSELNFLTSKSHLALYFRLVRSGVRTRIGKGPLLGAAQACPDSMGNNIIALPWPYNNNRTDNVNVFAIRVARINGRICWIVRIESSASVKRGE